MIRIEVPEIGTRVDADAAVARRAFERQVVTRLCRLRRALRRQLCRLAGADE